MQTKVRTTPAEVEKFRKIRATLNIYKEEAERSFVLLKAAYEAENRPMACDPANDSPERVEAFFAPKSRALVALTNRYRAARDLYRRVCLMLGGAKVLNRLHHLEQAGVLDA